MWHLCKTQSADVIHKRDYKPTLEEKKGNRKLNRWYKVPKVDKYKITIMVLEEIHIFKNSLDIWIHLDNSMSQIIQNY